MAKKQLKDIFIRYIFLILIALPNLYFFYLIFTPLTIYPVFFLLSLFFKTSLVENTILLRNIPIEIVSSCVAGSAYYLLLALNISTPGIKLNKRIKGILFSFLLFLIINILRIFFLSLLVITNHLSLFNITHQFSWYFLSIIFVIGIWFLEVKTFKINKRPFYDDIKTIKQLYQHAN
jgi:exosortase/archaeosortase family protein